MAKKSLAEKVFTLANCKDYLHLSLQVVSYPKTIRSKRHMSRIKKLLTWLLSLGLLGLITAAIALLFLEQQLPNVETLKDVQLQVPMKIYSTDGQLIASYGEKKRTPIALSEAPAQLINAIIATEDQHFFDHDGVDLTGLARATINFLATGEPSQGGSTITMQVARNFFLTRKKTFGRKLNEILLAIKIDHEISKQKILELYLNKIYFGHRAYGVAAAAQVYYGKPLRALTLPQLAMLAGLPKAPSSINPLANPTAALKRRNHVLSRMQELNYIDIDSYNQAVSEPITASYHRQSSHLRAPYVAEMIRATMVKHYGKAAYTRGLQIITTLDSHMQMSANAAVINTVMDYDRRHGYRGAEQNLGAPSADISEWQTILSKMAPIHGLQAAAVLSVSTHEVNALLASGEIITIPWEGLAWARPALPDQRYGMPPTSAEEIVKPGDVIRVSEINQAWQLSQLPQVEGALVALDPQDARIKALVGGFSFQKSNFNRVTQAKRQPGSSFKPFVYAAALAKGFTLASIINDAPVVMRDSGEQTLWRPQNDTKQFYGPTRLKIGLIRSRNLVSIRLLEQIGIQDALNYMSRFGFDAKTLPHSLSLALGSGSVTPLQLATGYAVFANGGARVTPYLINRIVDSSGHLVYQAQAQTACINCHSKNTNPEKLDNTQLAEAAISPQIAYLMVHALQEVIQYGTGRRARVLKRRDLAGKTGTTNDQHDAWFSGFNTQLVATTWLGFDQPRTLREYAAQTALPMWIEFMQQALAGTPEQTLKQPAGLVTVRIDKKTGQLASANDQNTLFEIFRRSHAPQAITSNESNDSLQSNTQENDELF